MVGKYPVFNLCLVCSSPLNMKPVLFHIFDGYTTSIVAFGSVLLDNNSDIHH